MLGESKLDYIGYSYGSWLGAWYARLFPDRVGRMLLDGVDNIADSLAWVSDKGLGPQRILDQVMLPYAARHNDKLGLGDAATLRNALLALSPELQEVLFDNIEFAKSSKIQDSILWMSAAVGLHALMQAHPDADEEAMRVLIESHDAFSPVPRINADVKKFALALVDKLTGDDDDDDGPDTMAVQDADGRIRILPTFNVLMSVRCNESAKVGDAQYWLEKSHEAVLRYPTAGGFAAGNFCAHWTLPTRPFPAATTTENAPLLMLQSRYDGQTPIEGAMATLAALPQARMIVVEDEYEHGVFPYGTQCVDRQVADYFLDGTLPQRLGSCAGKPFGGAVNGTSPARSD
ncbi:Tripeptidyl aminopeptidase precursor [compost metagenome]